MRRLVLLGGGHAHVHCLSAFAASPPKELEVTLISPFVRQVYSGMLPGWIAGHYEIDECVIPLLPLAYRAHVAFRQTAAAGLDLANRTIKCADGSTVAFDILSIDTGPVADLAHLPGTAQHALAVRPIETFIEVWDSVRPRLLAQKHTRIVMIGGGAAGVELALALHHAMQSCAGKFEVTLISAVNSLPGTAGKRLERAMSARGIRVLADTLAVGIEAGRVVLREGRGVDADLIIVSTGTAAAAWPRDAGLKADTGGFILVDEFLQSVSHANVFAAGDCATMMGSARPKSGVYAVRAGPPLAENLRRAARGKTLAAYIPQQNSLYLISTGAKYAVGSWNGLAWEGSWVWRWKDFIDRGFVERYR
jgi:pyridine nucleotide-disulfide oxidoreductase family protein